jgi:transposase-like protein
MIQVIVTYECPDCGSVDLVKNGHDYKGSQKYHCKNCNRYGTLQAKKGYSQQQQSQVKQAVLERSSLRGGGADFCTVTLHRQSVVTDLA